MAKGTKELKNIFTINPYMGEYNLYESNVFKSTNKLKYNKNNYMASYVLNKDVIMATLKVSDSILEEDIDELINYKIYDELNLDQTEEYKVDYFEVKNNDDENHRKFSVFIIRIDTLTQLFGEIVEEVSFLDYIGVAPLLFEEIYNIDLLPKTGTDIFMYMTKTDTFLSVYKDGQFVYSKSIEYSLNSIFERFCNEKGEEIDKKDFFNILTKEGIKSEDIDFQQNIMKVFGEMFVSINDIFIYIKRAFNISEINNLFIGTEEGNIPGIDIYANNYLGIQSESFNFDYNFDNKDNLSTLLLLKILNERKGDAHYNINLTTFHRPPTFQKRASGQFIISTILGLTVAISYPLYFLVHSYVDEATIYGLNIKNNQLTAESIKYKSILSQKENELKSIESKVNREKLKYNTKFKTLASIYDKKVHYNLKSRIFYVLSKDFNEYNIKVSNVKTEGDKISISLISGDEKRVTNLIKHITKKYKKEIYSIDMKRIVKEDNNDFYTGVLEISFSQEKTKNTFNMNMTGLNQEVIKKGSYYEIILPKMKDKYKIVFKNYKKCVPKDKIGDNFFSSIIAKGYMTGYSKTNNMSEGTIYLNKKRNFPKEVILWTQVGKDCKKIKKIISSKEVVKDRSKSTIDLKDNRLSELRKKFKNVSSFNIKTEKSTSLFNSFDKLLLGYKNGNIAEDTLFLNDEKVATIKYKGGSK